MNPSCFQPPLTFTGHYKEFPPTEVLQWNDFVPEASDLTEDYLRAVLMMRDEQYPRGRDTLVGASPETIQKYADNFRGLNLNFSVACNAGEFDLVPSGKEIEVNETNFIDYVHRVSELFKCFEERQVAMCTLDDNPVGLRPLVPARIQYDKSVPGRFEQLRTDESGGCSIPGTGWLSPDVLEFSKPLPFTLHPTCPQQDAYTAVFLFCRLGDCIAGKCVGWAHQSDALLFRRGIAPTAWVPVHSSINAYREMGRWAPLSATNGTGASTSNNDRKPSSNHIHAIRELREGQSFASTPLKNGGVTALRLSNSPGYSNSIVPPQSSVPLRTHSIRDRTAEREQEELRNSEFMRSNGIPKATTAADRALFSPTHELPGLFAPIQSLNI